MVQSFGSVFHLLVYFPYPIFYHVRIMSKLESKLKPERPSLNDFLEVYKLYPRKCGKHAGIKTCLSTIKTIEELHELRKAVLIYTKHCQDEQKEKCYILHFSTFMNKDRWKDYLDDDFDQVTLSRKGIKGIKEILEDLSHES